MRKLVLGLVMAAGLLVAGSARASYVCNYEYLPITGTPGTYGYLSTTFYTGPHCTGSFVSTDYFCSTGATATYCATSATCGGPSYLYSEAALHSLVQMLQQAEINGRTALALSCGSIAGAWVSFTE